jgi:hypothetical protein
MKCEIKSLVGENCITLEDGQKVYDQIYLELKAGRPVELDFTGTEVFASPFFNAAIGRLLKDIEADDLNKLLTVSHLTSAGMEVLKRVIENSKEYYSDAETRKALDDILSEQAEDK